MTVPSSSICPEIFVLLTISGVPGFGVAVANGMGANVPKIAAVGVGYGEAGVPVNVGVPPGPIRNPKPAAAVAGTGEPLIAKGLAVAAAVPPPLPTGAC